ncbi:hypothetical protein A3C73_01415 [Candidatus Giovannonibacteria bacterium RIFCSPHIGHO2_02_FULL_44_11]|nr:MAG: hypothetical protein A3C73_01415 [Candidatus Giovannonibacteria bacterium RIFCSPHIGHO2_02_FULL_44_11]
MNLKIIVISLTAGILLFTGYLASFKYLKLVPEPVFCTQDALQCPDGSYVSRTGPNCEFAECPNVEPSMFDISDWQTYRNEKYGFEFIYPSNLYAEIFEQENEYYFVRFFEKKELENEMGEYPSISVQIYDNKNNLVLNQWWDNNLSKNYPNGGKLSVLTSGSTTVLKFLPKNETSNEMIAYPFKDKILIFSSEFGGSSLLPSKSLTDITDTLKIFINTNTSTWQTYRNEKYGFEVKYPANYSEHYKVQDGLLSQHALDETVSLVTQRKFGNDLITSPVNITIYRNPTDMTAMEWISNNLGNVTRTTENSVVLYEYNRPGKELLARATFLTKNINPDFIIEFSFELEYFGNLNIYPSDEQYIQTYNQILSTFKFIK